ncbi:hypothetical protein GCM10023189_02690 [Nibrella saemangeumensis]|uniref:Secretion system C-terminal sorting domain-containing protein n=2 Tax=Nibrella saemangeumensis TaxID=1084526 RepID=A0ABP8MC63_9BACT
MAAISITAVGGSDLVSGPDRLCVKSAPPGRESVSVPLTMTVLGTPSSYSYAWSYKAPNSINYKSIPAKGVTIGKVSLVPGGSVPYSLVITGTKGNLNSLQGYLIRLMVSDSRGSDFAETLLDGGCELGSSTARMGVFTAEAVQVEVYPNPVTEVLQVKINGLHQPARIGLFDLQGRRQGQWSVEPEQGVGKLQAPVSGLAEGLYLLQVETASGVLHRQRVLKQR